MAITVIQVMEGLIELTVIREDILHRIHILHQDHILLRVLILNQGLLILLRKEVIVLLLRDQAAAAIEEEVQAAVQKNGDNFMGKRNLIAIFSFGIISMIFLSGCYTAILSPDQSTAQTTVDNGDSFYPQDYYGDYNDFYSVPWWVSVDLPPNQIGSSGGYQRDSSNSQSLVRNQSGGRFSSGVRDAVFNMVYPARGFVASNSSAGSSSSSSNNSSTGSIPKSSTGTRVESSNNNSNNSASKRDNGASTTNNIRNNDGSRKTDGRK